MDKRLPPWSEQAAWATSLVSSALAAARRVKKWVTSATYKTRLCELTVDIDEGFCLRDEDGNTLSRDKDGTTLLRDEDGNSISIDKDGNTLLKDEDGNTLLSKNS